jgi:hypothetical protein
MEEQMSTRRRPSLSTRLVAVAIGAPLAVASVLAIGTGTAAAKTNCSADAVSSRSNQIEADNQDASFQTQQAKYYEANAKDDKQQEAVDKKNGDTVGAKNLAQQAAQQEAYAKAANQQAAQDKADSKKLGAENRSCGA